MDNKRLLNIKNFITILKRYKFFISSSIIISILIVFLYIFIKPSHYNTYSIVEVKTRDKSKINTDDLLENAFYLTNKQVDKEIEIFKTFYLNQKIIQKLNLNTKFFIKKGYKKVEIYKDDIIKVIDINSSNKQIKTIELIPKSSDTYTLKIAYSLKEKVFSYLFHKKLIELDNKVYKYGDSVQNRYISLKVIKKHDFNNSIYISLPIDSYKLFKQSIQNRLKIQQLGGISPLIKISYSDNISQRGADYVNNLVDTFLKESIVRKKKRNNSILNFIDSQLKTTKKELDFFKNRLKNFEIRHKIIKNSNYQNLILEKLSNIDLAILKNSRKKQLIGMGLNIIRSNQNIASLGPIFKELDDKLSLELIKSLYTLNLKKEKLSVTYEDEYPELITVNTEIKSIKKVLLDNFKKLQKIVLNNSKRLNIIKNRYENKISKIPSNNMKLIDLQRKYQVNAKMYDYLLNKKNDMIKVATVSDYRVLEKAYISPFLVQKKKPLLLLIAFILGFSLSFIIAIVHNDIKDKIYNFEEMSKYTKLKIYGDIPYLKDKKPYKIEIFKNIPSSFLDSFRELRTNLNFLSNSNKKVILISSNVKEEGVATIASHLGVSFDMINYRTVIIDFNLSNPSIHKYFFGDKSDGVGMNEYLQDESNMGIRDIIFTPSSYPYIYIIPAGSPTINAPELVFSHKFELLIEKLREDYNRIIIKAPPITDQTVFLKLMNYSDIGLIIFSEKSSKKSYINRLEALIIKYNLKDIGLILNMVEKK